MRVLEGWVAWLGLGLLVLLPSMSAATGLPLRSNPAPTTTNGVPHVQIGVEPVAELSNELMARIEAFDGIVIRPTIVSLPGALGFWIEEHVTL